MFHSLLDYSPAHTHTHMRTHTRGYTRSAKLIKGVSIKMQYHHVVNVDKPNTITRSRDAIHPAYPLSLAATPSPQYRLIMKQTADRRLAPEAEKAEIVAYYGPVLTTTQARAASFCKRFCERKAGD